MLNVHALFHGSMRRSPSDGATGQKPTTSQNGEVHQEKTESCRCCAKPTETPAQHTRDDRR